MSGWQPFPTAINKDDKRGLLHPNHTREHHFIAQTEQRLYAFNPQVSEKNRNIYRFDKASATCRTLSARSVNIENNLEGVNLYLLKTAADDEQYNLETWFNRYESTYDFALAKLLILPTGSHDYTTAYEAVWRMKLLNILRNPYLSVLPLGQYLHRCLRARLQPLTADIAALMQTILSCLREAQCRTFGLSAPQYAAWLATLCAALSEAVAKPSIFECFAADWLNGTLHHTLFRYHHDTDMCWLNDTALCAQTAASLRVFGLPLTTHAFATTEISDASWNDLSTLSTGYRPPQGRFVIKDDDNDARQFFNRRTLDQCRLAVYGQSEDLRHYDAKSH